MAKVALRFHQTLDFIVRSTMTSAATSGSPRLLVGCCCFMTLISIVFYSVGFMRLAWELRTQNERIQALEKDHQKTTTKDIPLNKGKCEE